MTAPTSLAPPLYRTAQVLSVAEVMSGLQRVEIELDAPLAQGDGFHARLALPPPGQMPVAPTMAENGRLRWPEGPDAPHVRVYTFRHLSKDRGRATLDVVRHAGGPVAAWFDAAPSGAAFGLNGPAGGGPAETDGDLLVAGDMTALPAIVRLIEAASPGTRVRAWAACPSQSDADAYFGTNRVRAVPPDRFEGRIANTLATEQPPDSAWFAGERGDADALRILFRETWCLPRGRDRSSAFWRRDPDTVPGDPT
jgi:NADPH-dependent ferric siderophore reductase